MKEVDAAGMFYGEAEKFRGDANIFCVVDKMFPLAEDGNEGLYIVSILFLTLYSSDPKLFVFVDALI